MKDDYLETWSYGMIFLIVFFIVVLIVGIAITPKKPIEPSPALKAKCMEYALQDHKWEIGERRFEWLSTMGDPSDVVFFYESCLGHITGEPAKKDYMK